MSKDNLNFNELVDESAASLAAMPPEYIRNPLTSYTTEQLTMAAQIVKRHLNMIEGIIAMRERTGYGKPNWKRDV